MPNPAYQIINTHLNQQLHRNWMQGIGQDDDVKVKVTSPYIYAPCRRCPACLRRRSFEWRGRLIREYEYWKMQGKKTAFITLTFDSNSVNDAQAQYKGLVAEFFDRLRSKFRRSIRHYIISELGEKKGRFHIHGLLFDPPEELAPDSHFHRSKSGALHGSNAILKERWQYGIVDIGFVKSLKACAYVANYVGKMKPTKQGDIYVSTIICSNGLGIQDISLQEVERIRQTIKQGNIPYYTIGGRDYSYPYTLLRKYLYEHERMELSRLCGLKSMRDGGSFVINGKRFDNFDLYKKSVDAYLSTITTFDLRVNKPIDIRANYEVFEQESPDYWMFKFLFPDDKPF